MKYITAGANAVGDYSLTENFLDFITPAKMPPKDSYIPSCYTIPSFYRGPEDIKEHNKIGEIRPVGQHLFTNSMTPSVPILENKKKIKNSRWIKVIFEILVHPMGLLPNVRFEVGLKQENL